MKNLLALVIIFVLGLSCNSGSIPEKQSEKLPQIHITHQQTPEGETKVKCTIQYVEFVNNDSTINFVDTTSKFKLRGDPYKGGARRMDKKSYTIKLNKKQEIGGLPPSTNWILNANYMDKSFMRHKLSYDLFRSFHPENHAPICAYVEVYLNNEYRGLYVLMQKPSRKTMGISKGDTSACIFKDSPIFYDPHGKIPSRKGKANPYWQKYPALKKRDKNYVVAAASEFIFHASDSLFNDSINGIGSYFDINNIIDWQLYLMFSNNNTGYKKNFYLYKKDFNTPLRFSLWDADRGWGRDDDNEKNTSFIEINNNILIRRITSNNSGNYNTKLKQRWEELIANQLHPDSLKQKIDENYTLFKKGLQKNHRLWPLNAEVYFDSETTEQDIILMKSYIDGRYKLVENYLSSLKY